MNRQRLVDLDGLRGLAALAVVIFHFFFRYNDIYGHEDLYTTWALFGQSGVPLFFILSGFVISWTTERESSPLDFLVSRFSRLYPVYWFLMWFTFALVAWFGLSGRETSFLAAIANMAMFHQYLGIGHVDGVYWSLTYELTFYFWVFALFVIGKSHFTEYLLAAFLSITLLAHFGAFDLPGIVKQMLLNKYAAYFLGGVCFYRLANHQHSTASYGLLLLAVAATLALNSPKEAIVNSFLFGVFYLCISQRLPILKANILVFFGSISYALYLVHQNLGYIVINQFYAFGWHPLGGIFTATVLAVIFAYLATVWVEQPALRAIRRFYRNSEWVQNVAQKWQFSARRGSIARAPRGY